uniref:Uncharacterized protein n=1 Tax=Pyxicephalus adspersus TaxID=30357 RepID=A0AAV3A177_PYXAD|nr:TPA: hypothetical protein GDO54_012286 [Pyxicephalus adspersus]
MDCRRAIKAQLMRTLIMSLAASTHVQPEVSSLTSYSKTFMDQQSAQSEHHLLKEKLIKGICNEANICLICFNERSLNLLAVEISFVQHG